MKSIFPIMGLAAALLLYGCSGEPSEDTGGEQIESAPTAEPLDVPEDKAEPEQAAEPIEPDLRKQADLASQGMSWHFKPGWALFGPPDSEAVVTFRCPRDGGAPLLSRVPGAEFTVGATAPVRFENDSGEVTIELTAQESEFGTGAWEAELADVSALTKLFERSDSPIIATLDGAQPLALPANAKVAEVIRTCEAR